MTPEELLRAVRRRVRLHRATAALLGGGWLAALACVAVVAAARALPWSFVEPAGIVVPAVLLAARVAWTATRPVPDVVAARVADDGLRSRDALSAHVEFGEAGDPTFAARIAARAHAVAAAADPRGAVPRPPVPWWRAGMLSLGVLAAASLVVAENPQDLARERHRAQEAAVAEVVEELREAAQEAGADTELGRELDALADRLEAGTPDEALRELARTEAELLRRAGDDLGTARAAAEGLEAALQARPLPGADGAGAAAAQLEAAAGALAGMSDQERATLAQRLEDLAATQAAGAPDVAAALSEAAAAVASGDPGAADALRAAASAVRAHGAEVGERVAAAAAASDLGALRSSLSGALDPSPTGGAQVAAGRPGDGKGGGQGDGDGEGGGGPTQGDVGGGDRGGTGAGRGGVGGLGDGSGETATPSPEAPAPRSEVFAPDPTGSRGGDGPMAGTGGDLSGRAGAADTTSELGAARLPVSEAVRRYREQAARALDQPGLPAGHRTLISGYFERLSRATAG